MKPDFKSMFQSRSCNILQTRYAPDLSACLFLKYAPEVCASLLWGICAKVCARSAPRTSLVCLSVCLS